MKTDIFLAAALLLAVSCQHPEPVITLEDNGDFQSFVVTNPQKYLLLPVQENKRAVQVRLNTGNEDTDTWMDVSLAVDDVDYYVPFALGGGKVATVDVKNLPADAAAWNLVESSDEFDTANREYYRPAYHFTPTYGWMNDPNGMTYTNGEYHLFFQYNPYGSKWGNMHWGHAVSKDLVHWNQLDPAIVRDNYGHIFSGSSYIARLPEELKGTDPFLADVLLPGNGTAGDFIASYYTTHNDRNPRSLVEQQSFAISTDGGRTYRKFGAPVLKSDGRKDFRDPKLFWNAQRGEWGMIVSADNEMQFYGSKNLRDWSYVSAFGDGYGVQPRQFECPDFFNLPVEGEDADKWVMIVNVNPGSWFGGSASQYFTGSFDGTDFVCDNPKETVKWIDWGKDHYAAVTFSCEPEGRVIAMPWMSNWQYANNLPTQQYRSQMGMARELFAYRSGEDVYVGQRPVKEMLGILGKSDAKLTDRCVVDLDIADGASFTISNSDGEKVVISCNSGKVYMDRRESGIIPANTFACETWTPVAQLCGEKESYHLQLWFDRCSIEMFVDGGKASMTNLVYPRTPYDRISGEGISNVEYKSINI